MVTYKTKEKVCFGHDGTWDTAQILSLDDVIANISLSDYDKILVYHMINKNRAMKASQSSFVPSLYMSIRSADIRLSRKHTNTNMSAEAEGYISEVRHNILHDADAVRAYDLTANPTGLDGRMVITFADFPTLELVLIFKGKSYILRDKGRDVTGLLNHHVKGALESMHKLYRDSAVQEAVRPYSELKDRLSLLQQEIHGRTDYKEGEKAYYLGKVRAIQDLLGVSRVERRERKGESKKNGTGRATGV